MPRTQRTPLTDQPHILGMIKSGYAFEQMCAELLERLQLRTTNYSSGGLDSGIDMVAVGAFIDPLGFKYDIRIAVECKHYSGRGRRIRETDIGNIVERTLNHNCTRYLLMTSGVASSSLTSQIEDINSNPSIPLSADVWDGPRIMAHLDQFEDIRHRYLTSEGPATSPPLPALSKDASQIIAVHLHPDFQDELIDLLAKWNEAQDQLQFPGILPTVGYLRWHEENPAEVAQLIAAKLHRRKF